MRRARRPVLLLAAALLAAVTAACATTGRPEEPFATLYVENDSPLTVNIYALRHTMRSRLGQITGLGNATFDLRRSHLVGGGDLQILIDPVGSPREYATDLIVVSPGDVIELRVSSFIR